MVDLSRKTMEKYADKLADAVQLDDWITAAALVLCSFIILWFIDGRRGRMDPVSGMDLANSTMQIVANINSQLNETTQFTETDLCFNAPKALSALSEQLSEALNDQPTTTVNYYDNEAHLIADDTLFFHSPIVVVHHQPTGAKPRDSLVINILVNTCSKDSLTVAAMTATLVNPEAPRDVIYLISTDTVPGLYSLARRTTILPTIGRVVSVTSFGLGTVGVSATPATAKALADVRGVAVSTLPWEITRHKLSVLPAYKAMMVKPVDAVDVTVSDSKHGDATDTVAQTAVKLQRIIDALSSTPLNLSSGAYISVPWGSSNVSIPVITLVVAAVVSLIALPVSYGIVSIRKANPPIGHIIRFFIVLTVVGLAITIACVGLALATFKRNPRHVSNLAMAYPHASLIFSVSFILLVASIAFKVSPLPDPNTVDIYPGAVFALRLFASLISLPLTVYAPSFALPLVIYACASLVGDIISLCVAILLEDYFSHGMSQALALAYPIFGLIGSYLTASRVLGSVAVGMTFTGNVPGGFDLLSAIPLLAIGMLLAAPLMPVLMSVRRKDWLIYTFTVVFAILLSFQLSDNIPAGKTWTVSGGRPVTLSSLPFDVTAPALAPSVDPTLDLVCDNSGRRSMSCSLTVDIHDRVEAPVNLEVIISNAGNLTIPAKSAAVLLGHHPTTLTPSPVRYKAQTYTGINGRVTVDLPVSADTPTVRIHGSAVVDIPAGAGSENVGKVRLSCFAIIDKEVTLVEGCGL